MSQPTAVEISLDLRGFADRPTNTGAPLLDLWVRVEPLLYGPALCAGEVRQVVDPGKGRAVRVRVLAVPPGHAAVTADTAFAIYGVSEPPAVRHACTQCRPPAPPRYGPFACIACDTSRLCEDHAVVLDGRLTDRAGRLLAFCPTHCTTAPDGRPATFWCAGRACRGHDRGRGRAWADDRVPHPNAPATWYCRTCYADEFPPCGALGCSGTGSNRCEFVDPAAGRSCGKRLCNLHVRRWQVYGPHEDGLRLCTDHSRTARLSAAEVVFQVTTATAARTLLWRERDSLPSLSYLQFTLQKATERKVQLADILTFFQQVAVPAPDLQREVVNLRTRKADTWKWEVKRDEENQARGRGLFERVVAEYRKLGLDEHPSPHVTFVHL